MAASPKPMCVVTVGGGQYLMPTDAGMKVMQLMQQALTCRYDYGTDYMSKAYVAGDTPSLSLEMVKPSEIRMPPGAEVEPARRPSRPKAIPQQSLRLTRKD